MTSLTNYLPSYSREKISENLFFKDVLAGFSLGFGLKESLGLSPLVLESPSANCKSHTKTQLYLLNDKDN